MKQLLIVPLAMALAAWAFADPQVETESSTEANKDSRLLRMTWEVNSCVAAANDTSGRPQECFKPAEFRHGDRLYLREAATGQCRSDSENTQRPVVLSFVQDNNRELNIFFGCIVSESQDSGLGELVIEFIDDPLGVEQRKMKTLTIQHVRVAGERSSLEACKRRLGELSNGRLNELAEGACLTRPHSPLMHWKIATRCLLAPGSNECDPDETSPRSPPEDGQGTGSGQE